MFPVSEQDLRHYEHVAMGILLSFTAKQSNCHVHLPHWRNKWKYLYEMIIYSRSKMHISNSWQPLCILELWDITRPENIYLLSIRNKYVLFYIIYLFVELLQLSWGLKGQAAADVWWKTAAIFSPLSYPFGTGMQNTSLCIIRQSPNGRLNTCFNILHKLAMAFEH